MPACLGSRASTGYSFASREDGSASLASARRVLALEEPSHQDPVQGIYRPTFSSSLQIGIGVFVLAGRRTWTHPRSGTYCRICFRARPRSTSSSKTCLGERVACRPRPRPWQQLRFPNRRRSGAAVARQGLGRLLCLLKSTSSLMQSTFLYFLNG